MNPETRPLSGWMMIGLAVCLISFGCVPSTKETQPVSGPPPSSQQTPAVPKGPADADVFTHTVQWEGESLSIIAKWYTGSLMNWKALARANPQLDPDRIHVGDRIAIPGELIKNRESLPQFFVADHAPKPGRDPAAEPEADEEEETPTLFGPKEYKP